MVPIHFYSIKKLNFFTFLFVTFTYYFRFSASLNCFACHFTYTNSLSTPGADEDEWCANDTLVSMDPDNVIRPCAPWEKYCSTTIVTMQKSFTTITRQCAETCSNGCEASGYGQDHKLDLRADMSKKNVSCTECCEHDKCNNNHTLVYYFAVMAQQHTGWTKPVKNEASFNKRENLKFPY